MSTISSGSAVLRTIDDLRGPAGRLEALLNAGAADAPYAALVCHPHPLGGGTMHNKVVYHTMKALQSFGLPVLRFNFRGTGLSEGVHDGHEEQGDVEAALDWLEREFHLPIIFAGFSFGAAIGLRTSCGDERSKADRLDCPSTPKAVTITTVFCLCAHSRSSSYGMLDQYGPMPQAEEVFHRPQPADLVRIPGADHFFAGKLIRSRPPSVTGCRRIFSPLKSHDI